MQISRKRVTLLLSTALLFVAAGGLLAWWLTAQTVIANSSAVVVYKSPTCGCCNAWIEHLRRAGLTVEPRDTAAMTPLKTQLGVPLDAASCHTAVVDGYFVEGHVPVEDIRRLLAERPDALGLAVPGMPIGSPGMEQGDRRDSYETLLVKRDGSTEVFARHGGTDPS